MEGICECKSKNKNLNEFYLFVCEDCLKLCCEKCGESHKDTTKHKVVNLFNNGYDIMSKMQTKVKEIEYFHKESKKETEDYKEFGEKILYKHIKDYEELIKKQNSDKLLENTISELKNYREDLSLIINQINNCIQKSNLDSLQEQFCMYTELAQAVENLMKKLENEKSHALLLNDPLDIDAQIRSEEERNLKLKTDIMDLYNKIQKSSQKISEPDLIQNPNDNESDMKKPVLFKYPNLNYIPKLIKKHSIINVYNIDKNAAFDYQVKNMALPYSCDFCFIESPNTKPFPMRIFISGGMFDQAIFLNSLFEVILTEELNTYGYQERCAFLELRKPMRYDRQKHTFVACNNNILCTIGGNGSTPKTSQSSEFYEIKENRWIKGENLRFGRTQAAACTIENILYVFGGLKDYFSDDSAIECCNFHGNLTWTAVAFPKSVNEILSTLKCVGSIRISQDEILICGGMHEINIENENNHDLEEIKENNNKEVKSNFHDVKTPYIPDIVRKSMSGFNNRKGDKKIKKLSDEYFVLDLKKLSLVTRGKMPISTALTDSKPIWHETCIAFSASHCSKRGDKLVYPKCNLVYSPIRNKWIYAVYKE